MTVALGGFGSMVGALVAGILIGEVEAVTAAVLEPSLKQVGIFAIYMLVLMVPPARTVRQAVSAVMQNAITRRRRRELLVGLVLLVALILLPLPIADVLYPQPHHHHPCFSRVSRRRGTSWVAIAARSRSGTRCTSASAAMSRALLFVQSGIPPTLGMFAGGIAAALCALLVGWPCFRLSGHYYAIATVVVGEIGLPAVPELGFRGRRHRRVHPVQGRLLDGAAVPHAEAAVSLRRAGIRRRRVASGVVAGGLALGLRLARRSRTMWWPPAASAFAYSASKMAAAGISGFLTGVGGAIYAQYVGYIDPDSVLAGSFSILIALPAVLGGVGTLWGPVLGAAVLIPVSELSRSYLGGSGRGIDLMIYGMLIVVVSLARPQGTDQPGRGEARCPRCLRFAASASRSAVLPPMSILPST